MKKSRPVNSSATMRDSSQATQAAPMCSVHALCRLQSAVLTTSIVTSRPMMYTKRCALVGGWLSVVLEQGTLASVAKFTAFWPFGVGL